MYFTTDDLRHINSMTKYPSIETYHKLDPSNGMLTEESTDFGDSVVFCTEKIDGCLVSTTRISMADGSRRHISKVQVGDEVLGVDQLGRIVATPVVNTFNNGRAERWMKVVGRRAHAGRGSSFFAVICTPNHRFWDPEREEYVLAEKLAVGDSVLSLRSELGLTPCQKSVLLGKLLGDGHLQRAAAGSMSVVWGHREADRDYVAWTSRALADLASDSTRTLTSGYGSTIHTARTTFHPSIAEHFGSMVERGTKRVPEWIADALDPIALAFWYMDDGSLITQEGQEDRATLSTCAFDGRDLAVLMQGLARLGIKGELMNADHHPVIRFNSAAAEQLFLLVAPYVPPVMQRKLPERYRGHDGWLPPVGHRQFQTSLVTQVVERVEYDPKHVSSSRYDLETGTHNFFANGILVHNSNARIAVFPDGDWVIGSREELLTARDDRIANPALNIVGAVRHVAEELAGRGFKVPTVFYGEVYGGGIGGQWKNYANVKGQHGFRLFDVAEIHGYDDMLTWPIERVAAWRDGGGQHWHTEDGIQHYAGAAPGIAIAPRILALDASELPRSVELMHNLLADVVPQTAVALGGEPGKAEGLVLRTYDRSVIAKARFEDYHRTLKRRNKTAAKPATKEH